MSVLFGGGNPFSERFVMNKLATDDKSEDDASTDGYDENFGHLLHWERVASSNKVGKGFAGKHRIHRVVRLHWP